MEAPPGFQAKLDLARSWIGKIESWPWIKSVAMERRKTAELAPKKGKAA